MWSLILTEKLRFFTGNDLKDLKVSTRMIYYKLVSHGKSSKRLLLKEIFKWLQIFLIEKFWLNNICRRVLPTVEPGYMKPLLPTEAPERPESWEDIMSDIERIIMPGVSIKYK